MDEVSRIVCRYQIIKVDEQYWGKSYDQGNNRYPEGDVFTADRDSAVRNCRHNVDISYNPLNKDNSKMAQPTSKSKAVEDGLQNTFGFDRRKSINANVCIPPPIGCGKPATEFNDVKSEKEFTISGFCQKCQDRIFG
jgi:hypothetical protein